VGTLYRLAAAIYCLDLDIYSGDVDTLKEEGELYSQDRFFLRPVEGKERDSAEIYHSLGVLMETLMSDRIDPEKLLKQHDRSIPDPSYFFEKPPELVFDTDTEKQETRFYIETTGRTGLLIHLSRLFFLSDINIVTATIRTSNAGRAQDQFHLQFNGKPLSAEQCTAIENRILGR
jgi:UTP:GlnB (protein PII) uridylyltransferase